MKMPKYSKRRSDFIPLHGNRFGNLTVIGEDNSGKKQSGCRILYRCKCDCGGYTLADRWALESGHKTKCEKCSGKMRKRLSDRSIQHNNTSGCSGVDFNKGQWRVRFTVNNITYLLGRYKTKEEAIAARTAAELFYKKNISKN